jgi:hypothetical protein
MREVVVAMRRYADPVEVRRGWVPDVEMEGPEQFLWHGKLWKVRAVIATWVETGVWWSRSSDEAGNEPGNEPSNEQSNEPGNEQSGATIGDLLTERELWRVEAGRSDISGVFDLSFDWSDGRWQLVGCTD